MLNFITSNGVIAFAAGVLVGAVGYKLVAEKKINPRALEKTVSDFASRFKKSEPAEAAAEPASEDSAK